MNKKVISGGVIGALVIFLISFGLLLLLNQILTDLAISTTNLVVSLIIFLLAPVGGGFLAGLIGSPNPLRAGLLAGSIAGLMILVSFLLIFGFSFQTLLSGLVVVFVWVILSRVSSGFARRG
jgi:hypothetical protein